MTRLLLCPFAACALLGASTTRADYIDHFADPFDIGLLKVPRTGTTRVLVLPVIIDDQGFDQGNEAGFLAELAAFYDAAATGWAFTSYWETASLGRFRPEATVAEPVHFATCPPLGAYADCQIPRGAGLAQGDTAGAVEVMVDAFVFLDQALRCASDGPAAGTECTAGGGVDFTQFDMSGIVAGIPDQVLDGLILVSNAGFPGIALPIKDLTNNTLIQLLGPFPDFVYHGVLVGAVAIAGSARAPQHTTWVSVHEFGHLMGWADLYNEDGTTTDMPYTLMGGWFYQDPASLPDPFSRMAAGFSHVVQVAGNGTFAIGAADLTGTVLKVGTGDEHFLIELRRKVDGVLDGDLTLPFGVVVERVRLHKRPSPERGQYFGTLQNCVNCVPFDTFLAIEQADGLFDLERRLPRDDDEDLFLAGSEIVPSDDTTPRSLEHALFSTNRYDGTRTDITIRVLQADAEHATIEIESPAVGDPCAEIVDFCQVGECSIAEDGSAECGRVILPLVLPPPQRQCACRATSTPSSAAAVALALLVRALARGSRRRLGVPRGIDALHRDRARTLLRLHVQVENPARLSPGVREEPVDDVQAVAAGSRRDIDRHAAGRPRFDRQRQGVLTEVKRDARERRERQARVLGRCPADVLGVEHDGRGRVGRDERRRHLLARGIGDELYSQHRRPERLRQLAALVAGQIAKVVDGASRVGRARDPAHLADEARTRDDEERAHGQEARAHSARAMR